MKKKFVMSLSQSYRQDLLDAIQLAEQGDAVALAAGVLL